MELCLHSSAVRSNNGRQILGQSAGDREPNDVKPRSKDSSSATASLLEKFTHSLLLALGAWAV
jgi:hypothetical protein